MALAPPWPGLAPSFYTQQPILPPILHLLPHPACPSALGQYWGGMLSTHIKATPLISTNGPQERALSPTSIAGTGTAASLEQVRGTPESPWLLPTMCTHSHVHAEKRTHTPTYTHMHPHHGAGGEGGDWEHLGWRSQLI